jgi:hypothetical protein
MSLVEIIVDHSSVGMSLPRFDVMMLFDAGVDGKQNSLV